MTFLGILAQLPPGVTIGQPDGNYTYPFYNVPVGVRLNVTQNGISLNVSSPAGNDGVAYFGFGKPLPPGNELSATYVSTVPPVIGAGTATPVPLRNGPATFIRACYQQPTTTLSTWASRGCNTAIEPGGGVDVSAWDAACASAGLARIRAASSTISGITADIADQTLLAWALPDEPSNTSDGQIADGHVTINASVYQNTARLLRLFLIGTTSKIAIWANMVANHVNILDPTVAAYMTSYVSGGNLDWASSDTYPINGNQPLALVLEGIRSTPMAHAVRRQTAAASKPAMAFIEVAAYSTGNGNITPDQFRASVWSCVINGTYGVGYFSIQLSPSFSWDNTPANIATEMQTFHGQLDAIVQGSEKLSDIIMAVNGSGVRTIKVLHGVDQGVTPAADQMPYPFEGCEITTAHGTYYIAINLSAANATLTFPRWGISGVSFSAYQVKRSYSLADFGAVAPAFTAAPTISGTAQVGNPLTGQDGTVTGAPSPTIARQWYRNGVPISGATSGTYTLVQADYGFDITFGNVASNSAGPASSVSAATFIGFDPRVAFGSALMAWFDPDLTSSFSLIPGQTNNTQSWSSRVGSIVANTANNHYPAYSSTNFNGNKPGVQGGDPNYLYFDLAAAPGSDYAVAVVQAPALGTGGITQTSLALSDVEGDPYFWTGVRVDTSEARFGDLAQSIPSIAPTVILADYDGTTQRLSANGNTFSTRTGSFAAPHAHCTLLGNHYGYPAVGSTRDVIVVARHFASTTEMQKLAAMLAWKAGIQGSLSGAYATTPPY